MAQNETLVDPPARESSKEILQFLKDGEGKMEIGTFKNVTLVLGFTGSGKSTLAQFLTGNDEGLTAAETGEDTGEFTILDKNHKVCRGTIDSCTIIPTLYIDKETKSGFYDCPGFGDTRSVKHDISVTYFIKKVIDSVDSVKLLFTVNHHSVREGVDRQNFMLLVKNVLRMVKNIDKFKDGIALIVTKVDNAYIIKKRQVVLVPDKALIGNIAQFLENAKESLKAKLSQSKSDDRSFYTDAIKFIDILLEKDGDGYSRIGLFRRPDEEGPLSGLTLLQSGKERMQEILRSIQYIPKTTEDFGYTVSAESLNQMHDLIQQVNEKLSMTFNYMGISIQDHYSFQESNSKDIEELHKVLTVGHEALSALKEKRNYNSPIVLSNEIEKFTNRENITISIENVADVAHYDHFLGFIHEISGLSTSSMEWSNGLEGTVGILSNKRSWLNLMVTLQNSLSDYAVLSEVRRDPRPANVLIDCIDNVQKLEPEGGQCAALENFLKQIFKNNVEREYASVRKVKPNVYEWKLLKELLDFNVEWSCSGDNPYRLFDSFETPTLTMKGKYVEFSDMNAIQCRMPIKSVKIFALKKVFIDQSYSRIGGNVEVVIIAPNWEVIGSPKIALDGVDGRDRQPRKAQDGYAAGQSGHHGRHGDNGGEGGMFWGMGQNCMNCLHLSISANGGKGGAGQDGGDGVKGRDFHTQYEGDQHGTLITVIYNKKITDMIHYGERGGNGGNGGDGGRGGPRGMAKFTLFGDGSMPRTSAAQGQPGAGGAGGVPGKGGRSERRIHRVQSVLLLPWWGNDDPITLPPAADGSWGRNGGVSKFAPQPAGKFSNPSQTLSDYIKLLQVKIDTSFSDATTRKFLQNLKNANINDLKHHVGRRSVDHPNDTDNVTTRTASEKPSFIKKVFGFISAMMNPHKSRRLSSNNEEPITDYKLMGSQGITPWDSQTLYEIPKITSSESETQTVGNSFSVSHVQSNIFLLDYLYRMNNRARRERKKNSYRDSYDSSYAQRTAYRAYVF